MKIVSLIVISLFLLGCNNRPLDYNGDKVFGNGMFDFPIIIQFGAFGKGSDRVPTTIVVQPNEVQVTIRNKKEESKFLKYKLDIESTELIEHLSDLSMEDIVGDKLYSKSNIVDGGYMSITTNIGSRKFINVLPKDDGFKRISPDTNGLSKYDKIYHQCYSILLNLEERRTGG